MHKSLNTLALAGSALAVALSPAMAAAQDETETMPPVEAPATETPADAQPAEAADQDPRLASLPADKQDAVKAWPPATQDYFWSLSDERKALFWMLSDPDKVRLSELPEEQQASAWAQIESLKAPSQA